MERKESGGVPQTNPVLRTYYLCIKRSSQRENFVVHGICSPVVVSYVFWPFFMILVNDFSTADGDPPHFVVVHDKNGVTSTSISVV